MKADLDLLKRLYENGRFDSIIKQAEHDVGGSAYVSAFSVQDSDEASLENELRIRYQQLQFTFHRVLSDCCKMHYNSNSSIDSFVLYNLRRYEMVKREVEREIYYFDLKIRKIRSMFNLSELPHSIDYSIGDLSFMQDCVDNLNDRAACEQILKEVREWYSENEDTFGKFLEERSFPCRVAFSFRRLHLVRYVHCG